MSFSSLKGQSLIEYTILEYTNSRDVFFRWDTPENFAGIQVKLNNIPLPEEQIINNTLEIKHLNSEIENIISFSFVNIEENKSVSFDIPIMNNSTDGSIRTTDLLYDVINAWTSKNSSSMIEEFMVHQDLNPIEIYSFLQQFFQLTPDEIEEIVGNHSVTPQLSQTAELLKNLIISKGDGDTDVQDPCLCKLIQTNSSAFNRPTYAGSADSENCTMAQPRTSTQNFLPGNDDDELILTSQLGAGKGHLYFVQTDGGDDVGSSSNPNIHGLSSGLSRIRYKLVCANPLTIRPNNDCRCEKIIDLEWEYRSNYHWSVDDGWYIWGSDNSIYLEDWAVAAVNHAGNASILGTGMVSKRGACDSQPLTSTFTQLTTVATNVSSAISSPTISSIITAAGGVLDFFGAVTSLAACNSRKDSSAVLLAGISHGYSLKPGEELIFSIVSGCTLGGHSRNNGRSTARIISEGYVAGVLFSTPSGSEGCCNNEKIGSYALSSLSEFSLPSLPPIRKRNRSSLSSSLNIDVFRSPSPMGGFANVASTVGSFIGINGPWGGAFDPTGCCDDVVIDCYSKCGVYRECNPAGFTTARIASNENNKILPYFDQTFDSKIEVEQLTYRNNENENVPKSNYLRIFPNPTSSRTINIELLEYTNVENIIISSIGGHSVYLNGWRQEGKLLHCNLPQQLTNGLYILVVRDLKGNNFQGKLLLID